MIDGKIIYIPGHKGSMGQADEAKESFDSHKGWNLNLHAGLTPATFYKANEKDWFWIQNGRMQKHRERIQQHPDQAQKWQITVATKKSCAMNHVQHWHDILEHNKPLAFIEHDAICYRDWEDPEFEDCLILNMEHALKPPTALSHLRKYTPVDKPKGVHELDDTYPLRYNYSNEYRGSKLIPGTAAYVMTPKGAEKMIKGTKKYGLDQSDFMTNSKLVKLDYLFPSCVKFNDKNLFTSHGFDEQKS